MAIYNEFRKITKDTIQVDADPTKRWTGQEVKFINKNNLFYGTFEGGIRCTGLSCLSTQLSNASLYQCKIYDEFGNEIDLNELTENLSAFSQKIEELSTDVKINLPERIYLEERNRISADGWLSGDYIERIGNSEEQMSGFVSDVSDDIMLSVEEMIKQSGGSSSSAIINLSVELKPRIDRNESDISSLQKRVDEISGLGGLSFKGVVKTNDGIEHFKDLLKTIPTYSYDTIIKNGYFYVVSGDTISVDGRRIEQGDYTLINTDDQKRLGDLQDNEVIVIDAMDSDVIKRSEFERVKSEINGRIEKVEGGLNELSVKSIYREEFNGTSAYLDGRISGVEDNLNFVSSEVSSFSLERLNTLKLTGHINSTNYSIWETTHLSDFFNDTICETKDKIRNGTVFQVEIPVLSVTNLDGVTIGNGDYLILHSHNGQKMSCDYIYTKDLISSDFQIIHAGWSVYTISSHINGIYGVISSLKDELSGITVDISSMSCDYKLTSDDDLVSVITRITQKNGKIDVVDSRNIISSDIIGLSDYVDNSITTSINSLKVEDELSSLDKSHVLTSLYQYDGKICYGYREISTSDIINLDSKLETIQTTLDDIGERLSCIETQLSSLDITFIIK